MGTEIMNYIAIKFHLLTVQLTNAKNDESLDSLQKSLVRTLYVCGGGKIALYEREKNRILHWAL